MNRDGAHKSGLYCAASYFTDKMAAEQEVDDTLVVTRALGGSSFDTDASKKCVL